MTKVPEEDMLENCPKNSFQCSEDVKPLMALYQQGTVQKEELVSYVRLKEMVRYVEPKIRDNEFPCPQ